ncbi:arylsulfatase B-like [Culicoides brevitarsis]|uniref:arylsulfatase B-like n=1 Tax=Culicoides brevitarsis TaxID=469753 RepID=UPI00307B883C
MARNSKISLLINVILVLFCIADRVNGGINNGNNNKAFPHIVFIMADDMGYNDVSYNDPMHQIPTPNIDALGLNGVILNRHYSTHMCSPSRAALMTSEYPIHTGLQHWVIDADEPWGLPLDRKIMPQYFADVGYETYMAGKWHLGFHKSEYTPLARGFDHHFGYWGPYIDYWDKTFVKLDRPYNRGIDWRRDSTIMRNTNETYATYAITDAAVNYIEQHDKRRPMLMVVNHLAPHTGNEDAPMQAPRSEINRYSYVQNEKRRNMTAMCAILDEGVGKIMKALKEQKMLENSIVVFISDNGAPTVGLHSNMGSNYPFRGQKNSGWEGSFRTPAVIYSPLIKKPGRISFDYFHITDWLPTLMSAAGIKLRSSRPLDGIDQWNSISLGLMGKRREMLLNINPVVGWSSFIKNDWKLLRKAPEANDKWLSEANNDTQFRNEASYVQNIVNSDAQKAIGKGLNTFDVVQTLRRNQINCGVPRKFGKGFKECDFSKTKQCLFNIISDPCERYDVSSMYPHILKQMEAALKVYEDQVVPSLYQPTDPKCNPAYFNNTWVSWNDPPSVRNSFLVTMGKEIY